MVKDSQEKCYTLDMLALLILSFVMIAMFMYNTG